MVVLEDVISSVDVVNSTRCEVQVTGSASSFVVRVHT
jgi:hypothetical protein